VIEGPLGNPSEIKDFFYAGSGISDSADALKAYFDEVFTGSLDRHVPIDWSIIA